MQLATCRFQNGSEYYQMQNGEEHLKIGHTEVGWIKFITAEKDMH